MRIIVGGQSKHAGKTTVVCRLIEGFPDVRWTAVKISPHSHGISDGAWSLVEEKESGPQRDTARFIEAGAASALWLRGNVEAGLPALRQALARTRNWIVESTSAQGWLEHDYAILVVDPTNPEVKESASGFAADLRVQASAFHIVETVALRWKP